MVNISLIMLSVLGFATNSVCTRLYQVKIDESSKNINFFQSLFCFVSAILFFIMNGKFELPDKNILIYGILYGLFFAGAILTIAVSFAIGSMSLTGIIVNTSLVIPLAYSCLFFYEQMTFVQFIGLILIFITMILSGLDSGGKGQKANYKWFLIVFVAFICNGTTAVIQKQFKLSFPSGRAYYFMAIAYFTSAVVFAMIFLTQSVHRENKFKNIKISNMLLLALVSGIGSYGGNVVLINLSTKISAAVLYPSLNGGLCIAVAAFAFLLFKEKITTKKLLAIIIGITAIVVLSI